MARITEADCAVGMFCFLLAGILSESASFKKARQSKGKLASTVKKRQLADLPATSSCRIVLRSCGPEEAAISAFSMTILEITTS